MTTKQSKPQCDATVRGVDTEGQELTFCCQRRAGHRRGAHRFPDYLAEVKPPDPS